MTIQSITVSQHRSEAAYKRRKGCKAPKTELVLFILWGYFGISNQQRKPSPRTRANVHRRLWYIHANAIGLGVDLLIRASGLHGPRPRWWRQLAFNRWLHDHPAGRARVEGQAPQLRV